MSTGNNLQVKTKKIYSSEKKWDKSKDLILYFLLFLSILVGWLLKIFNQSECLKISIAYNLCCKIFIGLDPIVSILKLFGGNLDLFMTSTPSSLWGIILQRQIRCKWSCQWRCRKRSVQIRQRSSRHLCRPFFLPEQGNKNNDSASLKCFNCR